MTRCGSTRQVILEAINTFQRETGLSDRTLSLVVLNDTRSIGRLRQGEDVRLQSIERIEALMDAVRELPPLPRDASVRQVVTLLREALLDRQEGNASPATRVAERAGHAARVAEPLPARA